MKRLSNTEIDKSEEAIGVKLPRFYRKLLLEEGFGERNDNKVIYHPSEIAELYEYKFDDEELLYNKYFPIGCNNKTQELYIIDIENDKMSNIFHETHEDYWSDEKWLDYEKWVSENLD